MKFTDEPVRRWIGVDFDETLRRRDGSPILPMIWRVKRWLAQGVEVRIVTARINRIDFTDREINHEVTCIQLWCSLYIGQTLTIQACKSRGMIELWDDKAVRIEADTGRRLSPSVLEKEDNDTEAVRE